LKQGSAHLTLALDWIRQSKTQGDPDKAIPMSAYMRNRFDFLGWPLKQYARQEPELVRAFVQKNPQLPALTRREALKHLA
jgi:3-methyladenine DNA glycosylase AlkD